MIENDFVEIEFRDGRHAVPAHLAALIVSVPDTWTLTYEEAIAAVNRMALIEHLNRSSTKWSRTAPEGDAVRVLQHVVPCNPCFRRTCPTQLECFNGIPVDDVLAAAAEFMARTPVPTA